MAPQLAKLGKQITGKGSIYIKRMADLVGKVLKTLVEASLKQDGKAVNGGNTTQA